MGRFHKALPKVKSAYVTLQVFTPDLHKIYTDIYLPYLWHFATLTEVSAMQSSRPWIIREDSILATNHSNKKSASSSSSSSEGLVRGFPRPATEAAPHPVRCGPLSLQPTRYPHFHIFFRLFIFVFFFCIHSLYNQLFYRSNVGDLMEENLYKANWSVGDWFWLIGCCSF